MAEPVDSLRMQAGWLTRKADVHALRAWSAAELQTLAQALAPELHAFASQWGLSQAPASPKCRAFAAADTGPWAQVEEAAAWLPETARAVLGQAAFGEHSDGPHTRAAQQVLAQMYDDLLATLRRLLRESSFPPACTPQEAWQRWGAWSGWVIVDLPLPVPLPLLLDARSVTALVGTTASPNPVAEGVSAPELVPVETAAAAHRLRVNVGLAPFELAIGSLRELRVGDVLRLPHALDAPMRVTAPDGQPLCEAYLGKRHVHKAAQLVRPTP